MKTDFNISQLNTEIMDIYVLKVDESRAGNLTISKFKSAIMDLYVYEGGKLDISKLNTLIVNKYFLLGESRGENPIISKLNLTWEAISF